MMLSIFMSIKSLGMQYSVITTAEGRSTEMVHISLLSLTFHICHCGEQNIINC